MQGPAGPAGLKGDPGERGAVGPMEPQGLQGLPGQSATSTSDPNVGKQIAELKVSINTLFRAARLVQIERDIPKLDDFQKVVNDSNINVNNFQMPSPIFVNMNTVVEITRSLCPEFTQEVTKEPDEFDVRTRTVPGEESITNERDRLQFKRISLRRVQILVAIGKCKNAADLERRAINQDVFMRPIFKSDPGQ